MIKLICEKSEEFGIKYKDCDCYIKYENVKDDLEV